MAQLIALLLGLMIVAGLGIGLLVLETEWREKAVGAAFFALAFFVAAYMLNDTLVAI